MHTIVSVVLSISLSIAAPAPENVDPAELYNLGLAYFFGRGVPRDPARAAALFDRGCSAGRADACSNLGAMIDSGACGAVDRARVRALFSQACDGGDATGCYNLGILYANGRGVRRDYAQAARLFERACDGGERDGCPMVAAARARIRRK